MTTALTEQILNALAEFSSTTRLYELVIGNDGLDLGSGGLLVEAFAADEALNEVGARDVIVLSTSAYVDLASLLGQAAALEISLADRTRTRFAGDISEVAMLGSDGGFARYRVRISPWLARLEHVRNSRVWQDKTVIEIIDSVFAAYLPLARWRWSDESSSFMADAMTRSYCCQYRESDLDFVRRILAEEGLNWRFEQGADGPCMVLFADSTRAKAVPEDPSSKLAGGVRYHGASSVEHEDTVQALVAQRRLHASLTTLLSYDYKSRQAKASSSPTHSRQGKNLPVLESYDVPGQYAFADSAQARRYADLYMEAQEARSQLWHGRSTVRTLREGTRLTVTGAPRQALGKDLELAVVRATSIGVNNLPPQAQHALAELFGPIPELLQEFRREHIPGDLALMLEQAIASGYANSFSAVPADIPWRPVMPGSDGGTHAKPTAFGTQSALVIGPDGSDSPSGADELYCDRLGRVRIRFHWQDGAPASCWVRVAQRSAGGGIGTQFLPRIGQEVLVQFLEGDIDRPVIVGALYNGRGEGGIAPTPGGRTGAGHDSSCFQQAHDHAYSAQGNLAGGNSPVWHGASADSEGHRNTAAQWGLRSKEFGGSRYNQLLFDDTDAQGRVQLKCMHAGTELNLGHLRHVADNYRGSFRGLGVELRTDAYGAVRAGAGLLVSSCGIAHGRDSRDPVGDNSVGISLQKQAVKLAETLSQAAVTHETVALAAHMGAPKLNASMLDKKAAPLKAMLTAGEGMLKADSFAAAKEDASARSIGPSEGKLPYASDPVITVTAEAGVDVTAGQAMQLSNGETVTMASGQDSQLVTGGQLRVHSSQTIGKLAGAVKPGEDGSGLQLIASKGAVEAQAQADAMKVLARDEISVTSATGHVDWAAAKRISLSTAGGASMTIEGGNITLQCPGKMTVHAGKKKFAGGARSDFVMPHLPRAELKNSDIEFRHFTDWGEAIGGRSFKAYLSDGTVRKGTLDADGYARLSDVPPGTTAWIEYLRDTNPAKSHVTAELDDDVDEFYSATLNVQGGLDKDDSGGSKA